MKKNINKEIDFITTIFNQEVKLKNLPFSYKDAFLIIKDDSFIITIEQELEEASKIRTAIIENEFILEKTNGCEYIIPKNNGYLGGSIDILDHKSSLQHRYIKFHRMMDSRWLDDTLYYYRLLLPIDKCFWKENIESSFYEYEYKQNIRRRGGLLKINFSEGEVHVYPLQFENNNFIVIETLFTCTYDTVQKIACSISLALGIATSIAPFNYSFVSARKKKDSFDEMLFGLQKQRSTIESEYHFFTTNMYEIRETLKRNNVNYAEKDLNDETGTFNPNLQNLISPNEFEKIVLMIYNKENIGRAILILLESSKLPLDYQGAVLASALETICSAFETEEGKNIIDSSIWNKDLKNEFIKTIKGRPKVTDELLDNIQKKWNSLNLRTNKDKLVKPFTKVNYKLTKSEKDIINKRNIFLHGNIPSQKTLDETINELMFICLEMQKLCSILLFRHAGFKGRLLNNAVLFGLKKATDSNEPVFVL